jgi:hypothetical protein
MTRADRLLRGLLPAALLIGLIAGLAGQDTLRGRAAPAEQTATGVVISEFRFNGPGGGEDEFIEIYNPTSFPIDISGWALRENDLGKQPPSTPPGIALLNVPPNTILAPGQYYLIVNAAGPASMLALADQTYTDIIPSPAGIALADPAGHIVDQVGTDSGAIYIEGNPLPVLNINNYQSYERKLGGNQDSCVDAGDNQNDFSGAVTAGPQNTSSPASLCGTLLAPTSTSITSDEADPSVVGETIVVAFSVTPAAAAGNVMVKSGNDSCSGPLTNGQGQCLLKFTTAGSKTITAVYTGSGTDSFSVSSGETHQVNKADTTVTITAHAPNPSHMNQPVTVSFNVASKAPGSGIPTGTVSIGDGVDICSGTLANGTGSCQLSLRTVGTRTVTAAYQGDSNFNSSNSSLTHTVTQFVGGQILINEVAWAGTQAFPVTSNSPDQWIELWNRSGYAIDLTGWTLEKADGTEVVQWESTSSIKNDPNHLSIANDEYYLIECTDDQTVSNVSADKFFSCDLSANGEILFLYAPGRVFVDSANLNGGLWPAGYASPYWRSMERHELGTSDSAWDTYTFTGTGVYRSAKDALSNPINGTPGYKNWITTVPTPAPPTRVPTPRPQPKPRPVINEFLPRAGFDWNNDGRVDVFDEFIEVANLGPADWNTRGWRLDDDADAGSGAFSLPQLTLKPGERAVFYGSQSNVHLSDGGETIRLLDPSGKVYDAQTYPVVKQADLSWCRLPDLRGSWFADCFPTPNFPNSREGRLPSPPPTTGLEEVRCTLADTLPQEFILAECRGYGDNMWSSRYWDLMGWISDRLVRQNGSKWESFVE